MHWYSNSVQYFLSIHIIQNMLYGTYPTRGPFMQSGRVCPGSIHADRSSRPHKLPFGCLLFMSLFCTTLKVKNDENIFHQHLLILTSALHWAGLMYLFNPRGIWTNETYLGGFRPRLSSNAFMRRFWWDDIHLSTRKNFSIAYDTATNDYEAGLLLDCDRGTLDYYHKGMFIRTLADGLEGGYVWVMQFSCKKGTQITEFRTNTYQHKNLFHNPGQKHRQEGHHTVINYG